MECYIILFEWVANWLFIMCKLLMRQSVYKRLLYGSLGIQGLVVLDFTAWTMRKYKNMVLTIFLLFFGKVGLKTIFLLK